MKTSILLWQKMSAAAGGPFFLQDSGEIYAITFLITLLQFFKSYASKATSTFVSTILFILFSYS